MNEKITISVMIAFMIVLTPFLIYYLVESQNKEMMFQSFYSDQMESDRKKILLLGSSHTGHLNTTRINHDILLNNIQYDVFNLAIAHDTPEKRLNDLEKIILLDPEIVFYGVSYRDFQNKIPQENLIIPDVKEIFGEQRNGFFNPKLITLTLIKNILINLDLISEDGKLIYLPDTPFFAYSQNIMRIVDDDELFNQKFRSEINKIYLGNIIKNNQVNSLETIIKKLHEKDIKIVLFTTPLHKYYLEDIPEFQKEKFGNILKKKSDNHNVTVYDFTEKYASELIWNNLTHVAWNEDAKIFTDDITKMIVKEIEK
jgi:hypothetical protein